MHFPFTMYYHDSGRGVGNNPRYHTFSVSVLFEDTDHSPVNTITFTFKAENAGSQRKEVDFLSFTK